MIAIILFSLAWTLLAVDGKKCPILKCMPMNETIESGGITTCVAINKTQLKHNYSEEDSPALRYIVTDCIDIRYTCNFDVRIVEIVLIIQSYVNSILDSLTIDVDLHYLVN